MNGKAGKFLDEERRLGDYPFNGPVGYLEVRHLFSVVPFAALRSSPRVPRIDRESLLPGPICKGDADANPILIRIFVPDLALILVEE